MLNKRQAAKQNEFETRMYASIVFSKKFPKFLYHYTSLESVIAILQSGKVRATNNRFLNDASEYNHGHQMFIDQLRRLVKRRIGEAERKLASQVLRMLLDHRDAVQQQSFVFCLSEKSDDLSQWRAYGGNGSGVCIEFKTFDLFDSLHGNGTVFGPAVYDAKLKLKLIDAAISWMVEASSQYVIAKKSRQSAKQFGYFLGYFSRSVYRYLPLFKDPSFQDEKEWRFVAPIESIEYLNFMVRNSLVLPYRDLDASKVIILTEFQRRVLSEWEMLRKRNTSIKYRVLPIKSIRIGPNRNADRQELALEQALIRFGYWDTKILRSRLPYRV